MDRMKALWEEFEAVPPVEKRMNVLKEFARDIRSLGPGNFLYSDGESFFAHGDERHDPLTHKISWPGLHYIQIHCKRGDKKITEDFQHAVSVETEDDIVTLFASVPLNDDNSWKPLKRGEVLAVARGKIISSFES
jgi:glutamine amidotransferase